MSFDFHSIIKADDYSLKLSWYHVYAKEGGKHYRISSDQRHVFFIN